MIENLWLIAALWIGMALIASLISIKLGITVALIEVLMGVALGNFLGIHETTEWIDFLALMGSLILTFLAGAEIDPQSLKKNLKPSLIIGLLSFALPFVGIWLFAQYVLGWKIHEALIAGIALSTTSVAVIYSVMVEKGLSETSLGKLILAACFVTDFGTVIALGILFADFTIWMLVFVVAMVAAFLILPRLLKLLIEKIGVVTSSEPVLKLIFLVLFVLAGLATAINSVAILPAYILGLAVAGVFVDDRTLINRLRTMSFAIFTPFYFIKAGLYISLNAVVGSLGVIALLFLLKVTFKSAGVWPASRAFKLNVRSSNYTTLLMSTGLTFGSISALFGFNNGLIDQAQYTILITAVVLSAIIPTFFAQRFFEPHIE